MIRSYQVVLIFMQGILLVSSCNPDQCDRGDCSLDTNGDPVCICHSGYTGARCDSDINECSLLSPCIDAHSRNCFNVPGDYKCWCQDGYRGFNCEIDEDECLSNPCLHNGTCTEGIGLFTCACEDGYTGATCEIDIDECASNPCENNGRCVDELDEYTCECLPPYTGVVCELERDECLSDPCLNQGSCTDIFDGYNCSCAVGYAGDSCEINVDDCVSNDCDIYCEDLVDGYQCTCYPGYTGELCDTEINECESYPCQNKGSCIDMVNGYSCDCLPGFRGTHCQIDRDECSTDPCRHGSTCLDRPGYALCLCLSGYTGQYCQNEVLECATNPCRNEGICLEAAVGYECSCVDGFIGSACEINVAEDLTCLNNVCNNSALCDASDTNYTCECVGGYMGQFCHLEADECSSSPCIHGGTCLDLVNGYFCDCVAGYTGQLCETDIDDCTPEACRNHGECTDSVNDITCNCIPGYTGKYCEFDINECILSPCEHGGTCHNTIGSFICYCLTSNWAGATCQTDMTAVAPPALIRIAPTHGPLAGGTSITVFGRSMAIADETTVLLGDDGSLRCITEFRNSTHVMARTPEAESYELLDEPLDITLEMSGMLLVATRAQHVFFQYMRNPTITSILPLRTIKSGGTTVRVYGTDLDSVFLPQITIHRLNTATSDRCEIKNSTSMWCTTPAIGRTEIRTRRQAPIPTQSSIGLILDGFTFYKDLSTVDNLTDYAYIEVYDDPMFDGEQHFNYKSGTDEIVTFNGTNLNLGISLDDYSVLVGGTDCVITDLSDTSLVCRLPAEYPGDPDDQEYMLNITVHAGTNLRFHQGVVEYQKEIRIKYQIIIPVAVISAVILITVISIAIPLIIKKRNIRKLRRFPVQRRPHFGVSDHDEFGFDHGFSRHLPRTTHGERRAQSTLVF